MVYREAVPEKLHLSRIIVAAAVIATIVVAGLIPLPFKHSTRVTNSIFIARPPEAVFTYVTTPGNWPEWHPSSPGVAGATDHSLPVGERVTEDFRVAGWKGQAVWTVVEAVFPRRCTIDGTIRGRAAGSVRYDLSLESGGTRFMREFDYASPNMIFVLANRLYIHARIEAESDQAVQQLKQVL